MAQTRIERARLAINRANDFGGRITDALEEVDGDLVHFGESPLTADERQEATRLAGDDWNRDRFNATNGKFGYR
jgi:hypothetical protein